MDILIFEPVTTLKEEITFKEEYTNKELNVFDVSNIVHSKFVQKQFPFEMKVHLSMPTQNLLHTNCSTTLMSKRTLQ